MEATTVQKSTAKKFDVARTHDEIIKWIREWFNQNGKDCNAIIGMSGGKDSTITAALLAEALGKDHVIGISMPSVAQGINDADKICEYLGIQYYNIPIGGIVVEFTDIPEIIGCSLSNQTEQNIPPRIRMSVLYAVAQSKNGRVVNNCNLCEDWIGYSTKFGDAAGDFSVLSNLTVDEILELGDYMNLPYAWVHKTPDDGLPHSSPDEEKFGFTYHELSDYIRGYKIPNFELREKINKMHLANLHKLRPMPSFIPSHEDRASIGVI